jgi:hypothetical protein
MRCLGLVRLPGNWICLTGLFVCCLSGPSSFVFLTGPIHIKCAWEEACPHEQSKRQTLGVRALDAALAAKQSKP